MQIPRKVRVMRACIGFWLTDSAHGGTFRDEVTLSNDPFKRGIVAPFLDEWNTHFSEEWP